jgi:hypothetical protein
MGANRAENGIGQSKDASPKEGNIHGFFRKVAESVRPRLGVLMDRDSPNSLNSRNSPNRFAMAFRAAILATLALSISPDCGPGPDEVEIADAGLPDAAVPDAAGTPDTGSPDVGQRDAGSPDVGSPDVGSPDVATPDAGQPDVGQPGQDAAQPGQDAAQPGQDASQPGQDAAEPGQDAAQPGQDAGAPDSGTEPPDAALNHPPEIDGLNANPNPASAFWTTDISFTPNDPDGDQVDWDLTITNDDPGLPGTLVNPSNGTCDTGHHCHGTVPSGTKVDVTFDTEDTSNPIATVNASDGKGGTASTDTSINVQ